MGYVLTGSAGSGVAGFPLLALGPSARSQKAAACGFGTIRSRGPGVPKARGQIVSEGQVLGAISQPKCNPYSAQVWLESIGKETLAPGLTVLEI